MRAPDAAACQQVADALVRRNLPEPLSPARPHPAWEAIRAAGTQLWLDTGDLELAHRHWSAEFTHVTTNNTLINQQVQKGELDWLIREAGAALREALPGLSAEELVLEVGFAVNCHAGLRLVHGLGARVSVELHPAFADDVETSVAYGRRYHAICPEHFLVKVPLTAAGYRIARRLSEEGIPVNLTLGFSARQNLLAAAWSRPAFVNVFVGRVDQFALSLGLPGPASSPGETAARATQEVIRAVRERRASPTRLIGASIRTGAQVRALAGLDVLTIPPGAAAEYVAEPEAAGPPSLPGEDLPVFLQALWTVPETWGKQFSGTAEPDAAAILALAGEQHLFRAWSDEERETIRREGKIPAWETWREKLETGRVALDDLLTASALEAFRVDQSALDGRIRRLLQDAGIVG